MQDNLTHLRVILARPRGFCAGVVRAVDIVERALEHHGAPVYVRHEIVHNRHVVDRLAALGAVFVEDTKAVPRGAITIFSAHGVSRTVEDEARDRDLDVIDATCPLVRRVHREAQAFAREGYDIVLIGHVGHPEVEGTQGQITGTVHVVGSRADVSRITVRDPDRLAYVTQTTLSVIDTQDIIAALKSRYPAIKGPDTRDICYATQNRQLAVLDLAAEADVILVVGSSNSSNANRLVELAQAKGVASYLVDGPQLINPAWFAGVSTIGVTAGASTPETVVQSVVDALARLMPITVETLAGKDESVRFRLPERLVARSPVDTSAHHSERHAR
ncbi:MAG: 4-hydroxy-3-methylbut-2-enyl diphosphate reductase [Hyphomicrobium sp.]